IDDRDRRDRIELQTEHWTTQMPRLVDAYLEYRSRDSGDGFPPLDDAEPPLLPSSGTINNIELVDLFVFPTLAISIRTLSAFRQAHRTCPRFNIQAQCKALCHLHNFTVAFDIYLEIIHHVEQRMQKALGRDAPDWRLHNECPACFYRLEDEPSLTFDWLVSIDGNNSLKRWDTSLYGVKPLEDSRTSRSTYWLSEEDVDRFKDEVK
ncbi:hypothetical protein L210DRAFT_3337181, partial [Boletus edulis BED1]